MKQLFRQHKNPILKDSLFITLIVGIIYFIFLGHYPLINPDEGRYAEIAREMVANHHWITPHLNHILYFEKPILFYWLEAFSLKIFGLSEWAVRFWPAILGTLGVVLTYLSAQKLYDRTAGWYAAIILASSLLYFAMAHYANLDMTVTFFISGTLFAFIIGTKMPIGWPRRRMMWLAAIAAALAVLTKGLIGIAFPVMIIGLYLLILNDWRELKNWYLPSSILIFLIVALPWHIAIQIKHPSFAYFYFINQQFIRYATNDASRYEPCYFYSLVFLVGFFPWTAFVFQAFRRFWPRWKERQSKKVELFFLLWFFSILVFFTISQSSLIPYILPIFPPAAMITGVYFSKRSNATTGLAFGVTLLPLIAIGLIGAGLFLPKFYPLANPTVSGMLLLVAPLWLLSITLIARHCLLTMNVKSGIILIASGFTIFLMLLIPVISDIDHRSTKSLATTINQLKKPGDAVVAYDHYFQDLPFYLKEPVTIVQWFANELQFGYEHQESAKTWMITKETFWKEFNNSKTRFFIVVRQWDYDAMKKEYPNLQLYELSATQSDLLLSNQKK